MNDLLDTVLRDLAAEGDRLDGILADLTEDAWRTPTPAVGWDVAAQVAHLAWTDEVAVFAANDKEKWDEVVMQAIGDDRARRRRILRRWADVLDAGLGQA